MRKASGILPATIRKNFQTYATDKKYRENSESCDVKSTQTEFSSSLQKSQFIPIEASSTKKPKMVNKSTDSQADLMPNTKMASTAQSDSKAGNNQHRENHSTNPTAAPAVKPERFEPKGLLREIAEKSYVMKGLPRAAKIQPIQPRLSELNFPVVHRDRLNSHLSGKPLKHVLIIIEESNKDILKINNLCGYNVLFEEYRPRACKKNCSASRKKYPSGANEKPDIFKPE